MRRSIRLLVETLAAVAAAGLVLAVAIPLLRLVADPLPRPALQGLIWAVIAGCILLATCRPGGSLRR